MKAESRLQTSPLSPDPYAAVCLPEVAMCFDAPRMQEWFHPYIKFLTVSERQCGSNLRQ